MATVGLGHTWMARGLMLGGAQAAGERPRFGARLVHGECVQAGLVGLPSEDSTVSSVRAAVVPEQPLTRCFCSSHRGSSQRSSRFCVRCPCVDLWTPVRSDCLTGAARGRLLVGPRPGTWGPLGHEQHGKRDWHRLESDEFRREITQQPGVLGQERLKPSWWTCQGVQSKPAAARENCKACAHLHWWPDSAGERGWLVSAPLPVGTSSAPTSLMEQGEGGCLPTPEAAALPGPGCPGWTCSGCSPVDGLTPNLRLARGASGSWVLEQSLESRAFEACEKDPVLWMEAWSSRNLS